MRIVLWYLTLSCALLQILSEELPKEFEDKNTIDCLSEVERDSSILKDVMDKNYNIVSEDPVVYAFFDCMFEKLHFIKNGEFVKTELVKYTAEKSVPFFKPDAKNPRKVGHDAFEACKDIERGPKRVVNYTNCIIREIRK
ncbi:hypothetical protein RI129_009374 [Pyrocoelia pectoralis]|uniref:Uncharacterized protein n=1 Tax=Pyrocoelia pectoralis TaxID=417401 RepID=A0AAN7V4H7_9COLE